MTKKGVRRYRVVVWGVQLLGHAVASAIAFGLFAMIFMTEKSLIMLDIGLLDEQMSGRLLSEIALIYGVSACFWAMLFLVGKYFTARKEKTKRMSLAAARGTVMTETLIVLPVFFLLTFGLAQMSINSMAGLLTTLGTYQAARTVAVWGPEVGHNRSGGGGVSSDTVRDKARIAAAGVIAPVAPTVGQAMACNSNSTTLNQMLLSMTGAGVSPAAAPKTEIWSFADALDSQSFGDRGWVKMRTAYCMVDVEFGSVITDPDSNDRQEFTTTVTYNHLNVMPLVNHIFSTGAEGNAQGLTTVAAIQRSYTLTQQISPNPELPRTGAIASLLGSIGSLP
jgi:hypothetical protein